MEIKCRIHESLDDYLKMPETQKILNLLQVKKPIKSGELKFFNIECEDLDQHFICKSTRFLNRFINPFSVTFQPPLNGDILFLNEDKSGWKRYLCMRASKQGIKTVVVQHGFPGAAMGFAPLYADYLMCWGEQYDRFVMWGIDPKRLIIFKPEAPKTLKKIDGIESVFFLIDPNEGTQYCYDDCRLVSVSHIISMIEKVVAIDPKVVIKPHPHLFEKFGNKLAKYKVVWHKADNLIYSAERIYSFKDCTTVKDCEVQGKKSIIVEDL